MKKIFVDPFTFEVARTLSGDLPRNGSDDSNHRVQQALVAIIFALNDSGFLISEHPRRETWFCFGPKAMDLNHLGYVPDERLEGLVERPVLFKLERSELLRALELSERYRADFDMDVVKNTWRAVGTIIDRALKGELRLIGPEVENGLIIQDLTRSAPTQEHYLWFSLDKTSRMPSLVDLESPVLLKGQPLRIPIRTAALEHERKFVTLGLSMVRGR